MPTLLDCLYLPCTHHSHVLYFNIALYGLLLRLQAPKAANTAGDGEMEEMSVDEGESDVEGEEGDEDDGGAAKRRPSRGGKANDSRKGPNNGKGKQKGQAVKSGKDGNTQTARAARANRDQENGSVSEGVRPKGKAGKSTVGRKKQTGKALPTHAAKNGEAEPLSNDTPAVLNAIKTAPVASTSAKKKTRHKAASPKGKGASKGNETPEGRVVGEATSVKAPRKHKVRNAWSDQRFFVGGCSLADMCCKSQARYLNFIAGIYVTTNHDKQ